MRKISLAVSILLIVAMFAMITPVEAVVVSDLRITDDNNFWLWAFTYGNYRTGAWYPYNYGYLLDYDHGVSLNTYGGSKTLVYIGSIPAIKIRDGECVTFANAMANRNGKSAVDWRRGARVMDGGISRGTLVATFRADGTYDTFGGTGHVAIFDTYQGSSGFSVWDQNYLPDHGGVVARHTFTTSAGNYYVVQGPP